MRTFIKILVVMFLSSNLLDVGIYDNQCHLLDEYGAEQISVNRDQAYMNIYLEDGRQVFVPFQYDVKEVQVSMDKFFVSYVYEGGKIVEHKTPLCKGAI